MRSSSFLVFTTLLRITIFLKIKTNFDCRGKRNRQSRIGSTVGRYIVYFRDLHAVDIILFVVLKEELCAAFQNGQSFVCVCVCV